MLRALPALVLFASCATATPPPVVEAPKAPPAEAAAVPAIPIQQLDGFVPLRWDEANGKLLMEITRFGEELIWQVSLASGVGSNPVGLDRGQLGPTHLVRFERVGPRVLLVEPNYAYRAVSEDAAERRAVEQSFAQSVLAGFKVESTTPHGVLVDATEFFLSDAHGVARALRETEQGSYSLDRNRSAIYLPRTKAFPRNTEVEATLTFTNGDGGGPLVRQVTPTGDAVTVRVHHSFVELPPPGYTPRRQDPRVGIFGIEYYDYASPFTDPITKRFIARHRLQKKDPSAAISDPVQPIVYYVDNGVPEPIRSALVEGASWWNAAFEAAGFRNAFQVKVLPPDADPLDVRYNVINWVHRSTRGWSYGSSITDPRTGEIIKGHVLLGSLRIRQDVLLARGLVAEFDPMDPKTSPSLMALARIRQLSAHEVGHTLGLDHNMAASSNGRASVMDYPAPYVKITADGKLDLSEAYTTGVGPYDLAAIRYGYAQFAPGADEEQELNRLARATPLFVSDPHSRPVSGAHPLGSVWDNGGDPIEMLRHEIEVRRIALAQFDARAIDVGQPYSALEEKLLPLYLHHRYQLEAAAKSIGGVDSTYAVKEAGASPTVVQRAVSRERQRAALDAAMATLEPSFLEIPRKIVDLIPPPSYAWGDANTERFPRKTTPAFDPVSAAMTSVDITLAALLDPARAARLAQQRDNLSLRDVTEALVANAARSGELTRAARTVLVTRLCALAANRDAAAQVRAEAADALRRLSARLADGTTDPSEAAHRRMTRDDIARFLSRPAETWQPPQLPIIPPGPPI